jgi:hypothetical protein
MLAKGKAPKVLIAALGQEPVVYMPEGSDAARRLSPGP